MQCGVGRIEKGEDGKLGGAGGGSYRPDVFDLNETHDSLADHCLLEKGLMK